jgi:capsid protein
MDPAQPAKRIVAAGPRGAFEQVSRQLPVFRQSSLPEPGNVE